ncbi:MAG TPA: hypothetical protein VGJ22_09775, partial [Anaerolineales bacterium]
MTKLWIWAATAALFGISTAQASTFTFTSSVHVSGLSTTIPGSPPVCGSLGCSAPVLANVVRWISALPFDFRDQPYGQVDHFTSVSLNLTIFD